MNADDLSAAMDFDHVIRVDGAGNVHDVAGIYAPGLYDGELTAAHGRTWRLLDGYSGQDRYSGPIMHSSEYIGGAMARDILATPGIYVALVNYYLDDDDADGWAVARLVEDD